MSSVANVLFHRSQFPDAVRRQLVQSLRSRTVNQKFHYESVKQAQKWLAVHKAYSPYQVDVGCGAIYRAAYAAAARALSSGDSVAVIGLGCGAGQKDIGLLDCLVSSVGALPYVACDVSAPLALMAYGAASEKHPGAACVPIVCDLVEAGDLGDVLLELIPERASRVVTFFGMIPNFEPADALKLLGGLLRRGDYLLISANLSPGPNYSDGTKKVLPLYDNALTREWLLTFLLDLGIDRADGEFVFSIEETASGLRRITADFQFRRSCCVTIDEEQFTFSNGEAIRLFYSYRYTPDRLRSFLGKLGFRMAGEWLTDSGEEGVFLCEP